MHKIRLSKTDSVNSINVDSWVDVTLKSKQRKFPNNSIREVIDRYQVYMDEFNTCSKYRLILTINPFCSNVLFNPRTEMFSYVNGEPKIVTNDSNEKYKWVNGKISFRQYAIHNTSYSASEYGNYEYYPGYDIFNNHLLRSKKFKVVNKPQIGDVIGSNYFYNTLADYARNSDGSDIKFSKREGGVSKRPKEIKRHQYDVDDVLNFESSVAQNLIEENGWFGFVNKSTLQTVTPDGKTKLNFCKVLNNREPCEFINMYPDNTLFSFNPKYNEHLDRLEYNWDVVLSYPYENDGKSFLVSFYDVNEDRQSGIKSLSSSHEVDDNSDDILVIRSYFKHNLNRGDDVLLWYREKTENNKNDENGYKRIGRLFTVKNIGDLSDGNQYYYFYVKIYTSMFEDLREEGEEDYKLLNRVGNMEFRFRKVSNGVPSIYYLRKFRQIPNFKFAKEAMKLDKTDSYFEEYVKENSKFSFTNECYKLAFATTIYGDASTQITYTDSIDLSELKDNLGRPLSVIYATIVKRNKGNEEWYALKESKAAESYKNGEIEFSHCFSDVTSGLVVGQDANNADTVEDRKVFYDVKTIYNEIKTITDTETGESTYVKVLKSLDEYGIKSDDFSNGWKSYYGDLVELDRSNSVEYVLSDVNYRFNTYQREYLNNVGDKTYTFKYSDIKYDDHDIRDFLIEDVEVSETNRHEGYYYKAHYPIPIKTLGDAVQDAHFDVRVLSLTPIQNNGMCIRMLMSISNSISIGDYLVLCDDVNNFEFLFRVTYVVSNNVIDITPYGWDYYEKDGEMVKVEGWEYLRRLSIEKYGKDGDDKPNVELNWLSVCQYVRNGDLLFRRRNLNIPDYAVKVGANQYIWRPILSNVDSVENNGLDLQFANDNIYINKEINFFLKRQDKDKKNKLYCESSFPADVVGEKKKEIMNDEEEYKQPEVVC